VTREDFEGLWRHPAQRTVGLAPLLSLSAYRDVASALPRPTDEQIANFAHYVANAKSWYKHLPLRPPGDPFYFYIDPNAGRDRLLRDDGAVAYRDRTDKSDAFHYSWMLTLEYRERFGHLAFCTGSGTTFWKRDWSGNGPATLDPNDANAWIEAPVGHLSSVPAAVMNAGACRLTAFIHDYLDAERVWHRWPEESDSKGVGRVPASCAGIWPRIAELSATIRDMAPSVEAYVRRRPVPLPPNLPEDYPPEKEAELARMGKLLQELTDCIEQQRTEHLADMGECVQKMLDIVYRSP